VVAAHGRYVRRGREEMALDRRGGARQPGWSGTIDRARIGSREALGEIGCGGEGKPGYRPTRPPGDER
jgi:hypothetical protein